ncbi:hypothetical protein GUA87_01745 [Sneathiella sp. P13V-1]|uniref:hypothetical protein n=1 Tax=Sneathiella sp. P13V-1 TaxID=2697366 RepID=UPI00187B37EF|nr:hypothetical protein [Sneathiella sp. P13V-1]MBE7635551.1 hypothetical protein [Sneathiella sp. P13V-1]
MALIKASDLSFFRAAQKIMEERFFQKKKWFSFVHEKFAYDAGLWFLGLPYALYWITIYSEKWFSTGSKFHSFNIAFFIYSLGLSLLVYRALFSYLKWAFPVNILSENKDTAMRHRIFLGAIVLGLITAGAQSLLKTISGL